MKVCVYLHLFRCLEPCGGVGRHANNIVSRLAGHQNFDVELLVNRAYVNREGKLPGNLPLNHLPYAIYPGPERLIERAGRMFNLPKMDRFSAGADWYYSPMEGRLPIRRGRNAVTIHDVEALEQDLPWSNTPVHRKFGRKWRLWVPKVFQTVDRVLTVSEFSRQRMVDLLDVDGERISVIGNGVDDVFFAEGDSVCGQIEKTSEIIVIGGLRYKKGADWVLDVADALLRRRSPLKVVAIGQHDSEYLDRCRNHPQMKCEGMVDDKELVGRLSHATALMLLSHYEGFGIPPLEAMACGTPAVVSDRASLPEVVGDAGIVVQPERSDEIASVLDQMRTDERWYAELVKNGLVHAKTHTWDKCVDRLVKVLSS